MRKVLVVVLCGILLGVAAPAMAQSPTQGAYSGTGANQLTQAQSNSAPTNGTRADATSGTLPFTGLNLGLVVVVAAVLAGTGLMLRRQSGSDS